MNMNSKRILAVLVLCLGSTSILTSLPVQAEQEVPAYQSGQTSQSAGTPMDSRWVEAANLQLRRLLSGSAQNIAMSIQGISHPTGKNPAMLNYNVLNLGDHIMVQINVVWRGGMLGNTYQTSVNWEMSPENHLGAKVVGDTAMIAIAPQNIAALDDYFRQSVYPIFYSNMQNMSYLWK